MSAGVREGAREGGRERGRREGVDGWVGDLGGRGRGLQEYGVRFL